MVRRVLVSWPGNPVDSLQRVPVSRSRVLCYATRWPRGSEKNGKELGAGGRLGALGPTWRPGSGNVGS